MGEREEGRREGREVGRGRERGKGGEGKEGGGGRGERDSGHMAPGGKTGASLPEGKTLYPKSEARVLNVFLVEVKSAYNIT